MVARSAPHATTGENDPSTTSNEASDRRKPNRGRTLVRKLGSASRLLEIAAGILGSLIPIVAALTDDSQLAGRAAGTITLLFLAIVAVSAYTRAPDRARLLKRLRRVVINTAVAFAIVVTSTIGMAYLLATPGWSRDARFETRDHDSERRLSPSVLAVESSRGLVVAAQNGQSLGLYQETIPAELRTYWSMFSMKDRDQEVDSPSLIDGTQGTKFTALAIDPKADYLVSGGADGSVRLWQLDLLQLDRTELIRAPNPAYSTMLDSEQACEAVADLSLDIRGDFLLVTTSCGVTELWNVEGEPFRVARSELGGRIVGHRSSVSPDGTLAAVVLQQRTRGDGDQLVLLTPNGGRLDTQARIGLVEGFTVGTRFNGKGQLMLARYVEDRFEIATYGAEGEYLAATALRPISPGNQPLIAALDARAEKVALKHAGEPPSSRIWKQGATAAEGSLELNDDYGSLKNVALSSDGRTLVLSQQDVNTLYRHDSWVGAFLVPWR